MILAVILVLVGLAFVLAEVFFPSLGMFGLIAGGCIIFADVLAFEAGTTIGWTFVVAEIFLVPYVVHVGFQLLPRLPFGRRMILSGPTTAPGAGLPDYERLLGSQGTALTDLRPAGTGRFGEERVSVVALGGLVEENVRIVVVDVDGSEIRVRPIQDATPNAAPSGA